MKKQRVLASAKKSGRKVIKASKSAEQMLNAFEDKLSEFGIESCDKITSAEELEDIEERDEVEITDSDSDIMYEDLGGFGKDGEWISLEEIKKYWNSEKDHDPSLMYYDDFRDWFRDTIDNGFISEVDMETYRTTGVDAADDIFDDVTEGELNSKEDIDGCDAF